MHRSVSRRDRSINVTNSAPTVEVSTVGCFLEVQKIGSMLIYDIFLSSYSSTSYDSPQNMFRHIASGLRWFPLTGLGVFMKDTGL